MIQCLKCFHTGWNTPIIKEKKEEKMSAPIERNPTKNPYTNKPLQNDDLIVESKETKWFEEKVEECREQGKDVQYMEKILETARKENKEVYEKKIYEDNQEKKRREQEGCFQQ